jgi:hypothetical protein
MRAFIANLQFLWIPDANLKIRKAEKLWVA